MSNWTAEDHANRRCYDLSEKLCEASHLQGRLEARISQLESDLACANKHNRNLHIENHNYILLLGRLCESRYYAGATTPEDHARDVEMSLEATRAHIARDRAHLPE